MAVATVAANLCRAALAGPESLSASRRPSSLISSFRLSLRSSEPRSSAFFRRLRCTVSNEEAVVASSSSADSAFQISDVKEEADPVKEAADLLEIRVGKVIKAWRHEEAESLYVEEVDVGEAEPRIICSGLVKYLPLEQLQGSKVVVLANLKPRNMRGVKSSGMLMAASDSAHENVELLLPPEDAVPGERIWFGSEDERETQPAPATPNQIQKKKVWEQVQPHLKTDASCVAMLGEHKMRTSAGVVVCSTLQNANIS